MMSLELPEEEWVVAPGYEPVAEEFCKNFAERGELGGAFAAVVGGRPVLDLWGGTRDAETGAAWERDTLQLIFSGAKGLVAICLLLLIERGQLDIESPVAEYWPEFAAAGKGSVTVRQVVSHSAGLPSLATAVETEDLANPTLMAKLLADQPQSSDPRAFQVYHALTFGWLCGELIRRIDGRTIGQFLNEEISAPNNLDIYIGLPAELEGRVARLESAESWRNLADPSTRGSDQLVNSIWGNPEWLSEPSFPWNSKAFRQAEIPACNGIATARSLAALYGSLSHLLSEQTLKHGAKVLVERTDPIDGGEERWGVGFELQTESRELGPPEDAFGHTGAGGSIHGRWPTQGVGFSYVMNRMQFFADGDPRPRALLAALYDCAVAAGQHIEDKPC